MNAYSNPAPHATRFAVYALGHPDGTSICAPLLGDEPIGFAKTEIGAEAIAQAWRAIGHYGALIVAISRPR